MFPASPANASYAASVQFPFGVLYRLFQLFVVGANPVGPGAGVPAVTRSALKVPVYGFAPVLNAGAVLSEVMVVLVKPVVAPVPPVAFRKKSRFRIWPFGALKTNTISPFQVCGMFQVTDMADMLQAAGMPDTVILLLIPAGLLSGTGILIGPEQN